MKLPIATLVVVLLALVMAIAVADTHAALVYDRDRIIGGELWRFITCNWVHFSMSHLVYDLLAFGIAGSLIELRRHRGFGWFCTVAPAVIGATVFVVRPDLQLFGGLSGLGTGAIVLLALHGLRERGAWQRICVTALVAVAVKMAFEFADGQPVFAGGGATEIRTVAESHLAGAVVAVLAWLSTISDLRFQRFQIVSVNESG